MPSSVDQASWDAAKDQAKSHLAERARLRGQMTYSDLVNKITAANFEPYSKALAELLGEISREEAEAGRGMMTAIVVKKVGDMEPGPGFFELAKSLGRDVSDPMRCWVEEFKKVHAAWSVKK